MNDHSKLDRELVSGSAATAIAAAMARQDESARPDRLYDDRWAAAFVERATRVFKATPDGDEDWRRLRAITRAGQLWRGIAVRVIDDFACQFAAQGCRQIVIPGVGLDVRALRIAWSEPVTVFELDVPAMIAFRRAMLDDAPPPERVRRVQVEADLTTDWQSHLVEAGFESGHPSAWIVESVLSYMDRDSARAFVTQMSELAAPGSRLVLTYNRPAASEAGTSSEIYSRLRTVPGVGQLIRSGPTHLGDDGETLLARLGWTTEYIEGSLEAARLGRPLSRQATSDFITARRIGD